MGLYKIILLTIIIVILGLAATCASTAEAEVVTVIGSVAILP